MNDRGGKGFVSFWVGTVALTAELFRIFSGIRTVRCLVLLASSSTIRSRAVVHGRFLVAPLLRRDGMWIIGLQSSQCSVLGVCVHCLLSHTFPTSQAASPPRQAHLMASLSNVRYRHLVTTVVRLRVICAANGNCANCADGGRPGIPDITNGRPRAGAPPVAAPARSRALELRTDYGKGEGNCTQARVPRMRGPDEGATSPRDGE